MTVRLLSVLRANAVVPQVAEHVGRMIMAAEGRWAA